MSSIDRGTFIPYLNCETEEENNMNNKTLSESDFYYAATSHDIDHMETLLKPYDEADRVKLVNARHYNRYAFHQPA